MKRYEVVPSGRSETLVCSVDGNPRPFVQWYKNGKRFKAREHGEKVTIILSNEINLTVFKPIKFSFKFVKKAHCIWKT